MTIPTCGDSDGDSRGQAPHVSGTAGGCVHKDTPLATPASDVILDLLETALEDTEARLPIIDRVRLRHRLAELVIDAQPTITRPTTNGNAEASAP